MDCMMEYLKFLWQGNGLIPVWKTINFVSLQEY